MTREAIKSVLRRTLPPPALTKAQGFRRRATAAARGAADGWRLNLPETDVVGAEPAPQIPAWGFEHPEPQFPGLICQPCSDNQIRTKHYRVWGDRLRTRDVFFHRKQWEWFYIAQAIEESGLDLSVSRGLGFGVGEEPLTPWFASKGATIVATDYPGGENADLWSGSGELARSIDDLNGDGICDPEAFRARVSFEPVDMRSIPEHLRDFDFTWSSCAFEHLGSIEAGCQFIVDQLDVLRPGGVAVHTTELNISSETDTIDSGGTVLFRRSDIENIVAAVGDRADVLQRTYSIGTNPNDLYVAPDPWANTQLRYAMDGFVTTSYGLIMTKR